jgi:phosphate transport system permease protein
MTFRIIRDKLARRLFFGLTAFCGLLVFIMAAGLYLKSQPILAEKPLSHLLFSGDWYPLRGHFGFYPFITGTLWVTLVAVAIAIPVCLLTAVYLSEYAHRKILALVHPLIDLLAGIPSIVYGMWGVLVVVPLIKDHIAPLLGKNTTGYCVLAAGTVLAIMIVPVIIHVCLEVFKTVPREMREASLAVGATKWQTVKHVVLRKALPGIIAAVVLGLSRAFGETMAVLMVAGNVVKTPSSVFDPAYPLPALIANNYGEMLSIPLYDSALLVASLVLMAVIVFFNIVSRLILVKVERRTQ